MLVLSLQYLDELDHTDCENATASYHFPDWGMATVMMIATAMVSNSWMTVFFIAPMG